MVEQRIRALARMWMRPCNLGGACMQQLVDRPIREQRPYSRCRLCACHCDIETAYFCLCLAKIIPAPALSLCPPSTLAVCSLAPRSSRSVLLWGACHDDLGCRNMLCALSNSKHHKKSRSGSICLECEQGKLLLLGCAACAARRSTMMQAQVCLSSLRQVRSEDHMYERIQLCT